MRNKIKINLMPLWLQLTAAALIIGKLFDVHPIASWSWWAVTAPLWVPPLVVLTLLALIIGFAGLNIYLKDKAK